MRRFIYGTTWRTAQAARAADDVAARRSTGATVQHRDATRDGRPPGKDRSVVLIVAVFDGEQSAAPGVGCVRSDLDDDASPMRLRGGLHLTAPPCPPRTFLPTNVA
ncbi:hypothetical protein WT22_01045 [Burkholderia territorii]|nr:hypothetical protein WT22_01045 [Burkholderia territorii]KWA42278.1 hypothetical protein WT40_02125 [Burkholderia territorii]